MAPLLLLLLLGVLRAPSAAQHPSSNASAAPMVELRLGVLLPENYLMYPFAWPRVAPALRMAMATLPQLRFILSVYSTENEFASCDPQVASFSADHMKEFKFDPDLLLGLGCFETSFAWAASDQSWQPLVLRAGDYRRSSRFSTVVNAGLLTPRALVAFQARLLRQFSWTARTVVVFDPLLTKGEDFPSLSSAVNLAEFRNFTSRHYGYEKAGEAVRFIQAEGRVVFIYGFHGEFYQIMHLAHAQNMTNGDYVFFFLDLYGEILRAYGRREAAKPWQSIGTENTGGLREAFQTVLVITAHVPQTPEYRRFEKEMILRAHREFGVAFTYPLGHLVPGCYHDVLLLYLQALNETLLEGGNKRNTSHILEKMRSLKIQGVTGMMSLNSDNDRETDFDLWAMRDVETGEFQLVGHYIASEDRINWTGPIHWKKGRPPLDNPPCVFDIDDPSCGVSVSPTQMPKCLEREKEMKYHNCEAVHRLLEAPQVVLSYEAVQSLLKTLGRKVNRSKTQFKSNHSC